MTYFAVLNGDRILEAIYFTDLPRAKRHADAIFGMVVRFQLSRHGDFIYNTSAPLYDRTVN